MFRFRSDQIGSIRRQRIGNAFAESFKDSPVQASVDERSQDVIATPPHGNPTRFSFDDQGFISKITTPLGREWRLTNDTDGRAVNLVNPSGSEAAFSYDARGRLSQISRDNQPLMRFQHDDLGNLTGTRYPDSTSESVVYAPNGSPAAIQRRSGIAATFRHDEFGCLTEIVDGKGSQTRFEYGAWNRPAKVVFPNGQVEKYQYDAQGNLAALARGNDLETSIKYDAAGHIRKIAYADGYTAKYEYDDAGRLISASDFQPIIWTYDAQGHVISEQKGNVKAEYVYDASGRLCGLVYPGGDRVSFAWDNDDRLSSIRDWSNRKTVWSYKENDSGWVVQYPGDVRANVQLLSTGLTQNISIQRSTRKSLLDLVYRYDSEDRITGCEDSLAGRSEFAYDADGRLMAAGGDRFVYDNADNLIEKKSLGTITFDAANQPVMAGDTRCIHDNQGNLIEGPAKGGIWKLHWDARNCLREAEGPAKQKIAYEYDALGRLSRRREKERETLYFWAGETLVAEVEHEGNRITRRQEYLFIPGSTTLFATRIDGRVFYSHCDHLGSSRMLTDATGEHVWSARLDAWGVCQLSAGNIQQPWRFPGQYEDPTTGLHYNRFRFYNPFLGRYLSRDPLGYSNGLNLYVYANNNPINNADPLGLWSWSGIGKGILVAAAAVAVGIAVVALAPVALPLAIVLGGAAAGAVGFGLNQALNEKEFCLKCILKEALKGAAVGTLAALPFAFLPAAAGYAAFMGAGGFSGAISYTGSILTHPGTPWSWSDFGLSIGIGILTAGAGRFIGPRVAQWWRGRNPSPIPKYQTTPMNSQYAGENLPDNEVWAGSQVKYLTEAEQANYKLTINDGKIYDAQGNLFDTTDASSVHSGNGRAIFVMDENGNFYASKYQGVGEFHHSSLRSGEPVAAAGELEVKDGVLQGITDRSGHYTPSQPFTQQAINELESSGVDMTNVETTLIGK